MQKFMLCAALGALVACGVPPEEDNVGQSAYKPLNRSLIVPVEPGTLEQSQAWEDLVKSYE